MTEAQTIPYMVGITFERLIELQKNETDREKRQMRKTLAFSALYSQTYGPGGKVAEGDARVWLPAELVEPSDLLGARGEGGSAVHIWGARKRGA